MVEEVTVTVFCPLRVERTSVPELSETTVPWIWGSITLMLEATRTPETMLPLAVIPTPSTRSAEVMLWGPPDSVVAEVTFTVAVPLPVFTVRVSPLTSVTVPPTTVGTMRMAAAVRVSPLQVPTAWMDWPTTRPEGMVPLTVAVRPESWVMPRESPEMDVTAPWIPGRSMTMVWTLLLPDAGRMVTVSPFWISDSEAVHPGPTSTTVLEETSTVWVCPPSSTVSALEPTLWTVARGPGPGAPHSGPPTGNIGAGGVVLVLELAKAPWVMAPITTVAARVTTGQRNRTRFMPHSPSGRIVRGLCCRMGLRWS